jgi:hypothetical protein
MGTLIAIACVFIIIVLANSLLDSSLATMTKLKERQDRKMQEYYTRKKPRGNPYLLEEPEPKKPKTRYTKLERIIMGLDDEDDKD